MPVFEIETYKTNPQRKLYFWSDSAARLDDLESWIADQPQDERNNLARLLRKCFSHTQPRLSQSQEKFRKEFDNKGQGIYAIKSYQIRLIGIFRGIDFCVIHYLRKKTSKLSKDDIKTIKDKHNRYLLEKK